jgi:RNA polymerase sigma-70 factor (ECF subfamily)
VLQITRREALRLRGRPGAAHCGLDEAPEAAVAPTSADEGLARVDVRRALDALDPQDAALLELRYGLDLTQQAVASALGLPEGTVKVRLHRLRKHLATLLPDYA